MKDQASFSPELSVSRYDLLLAIIPAGFILAATALYVLHLSVYEASIVASLVGVVAVADGLFLHPPS